MKRYMNSAIIYAILAMLGGVFYREFTKCHGFSGKTYLYKYYIKAQARDYGNI